MVHQDNASFHTAQKTVELVKQENIKLLDRPPYSPDLSPCDIFTRLREQRLQSPDDILEGPTALTIVSNTKKFFSNISQKKIEIESFCLYRHRLILLYS